MEARPLGRVDASAEATFVVHWNALLHATEVREHERGLERAMVIAG